MTEFARKLLDLKVEGFYGGYDREDGDHRVLSTEGLGDEEINNLRQAVLLDRDPVQPNTDRSDLWESEEILDRWVNVSERMVEVLSDLDLSRRIRIQVTLEELPS